jgi:AcrR family transcriptional regulator
MTEVGDRRVRRTRRNLAEALTELILERSYEAITVQDILDRADIGRSTFYAHFRDKEALLLSCFDDLRDDLRRDLDAMTPGVEPHDPAQPSIVVFAHAYRHRRIYRALCGRHGGNIVYGHLHTLLAATLRTHLAPHLAASGSPIPAEAMAEFYTSGLLGILTWWVNQGFPHGPAHVAQMFGAMANPGIVAAIGHLPDPTTPRRTTDAPRH